MQQSVYSQRPQGHSPVYSLVVAANTSTASSALSHSQTLSAPKKMSESTSQVPAVHKRLPHIYSQPRPVSRKLPAIHKNLPAVPSLGQTVLRGQVSVVASQCPPLSLQISAPSSQFSIQTPIAPLKLPLAISHLGNPDDKSTTPSVYMTVPVVQSNAAIQSKLSHSHSQVTAAHSQAPPAVTNHTTVLTDTAKHHQQSP